MSEFFNPINQAVLNELQENSFVIFASTQGARLFAKIRGASAHDIGLMLGAAQASLQRQIVELRNHVQRTRGGSAVRDFDHGMNQGRAKTPCSEGIGIREFGKEQP